MKKIMWLLMLVFLLPVVIAQPPFQTAGESGVLTIAVPQVEFILEDNIFDFHVHVFNSTGFLVTNSTTTCTMHIYNATGNHILEQQMNFDSNLIDYYYDIPASITSDVGTLPFIVQCNGTEGGFISSSIDIRSNTAADESFSGTAIAVILIGIVICLVYLSNSLNKDSNYMNALRLFLMFVSFWLIILAADFALEIAGDGLASDSIVNTLGTEYNTLVISLLVVAGFLILFFIMQIFTSIKVKQDQEEESMLGK